MNLVCPTQKKSWNWWANNWLLLQSLPASIPFFGLTNFFERENQLNIFVLWRTNCIKEDKLPAERKIKQLRRILCTLLIKLDILCNKYFTSLQGQQLATHKRITYPFLYSSSTISHKVHNLSFLYRKARSCSCINLKFVGHHKSATTLPCRILRNKFKDSHELKHSNYIYMFREVT